MRRNLLIAIGLLLAALPARAHELVLDGPLIQGGLLRGRTEPGATVRFKGAPVAVTPDGVFLIGFGRDDVGPFALEVRHPDGSVTRKSLSPKKRRYKIQRIDGLPPKMVTPDAKTLARIEREAASIAAVRARNTPEPLFMTGFARPVDGPISGVFGSQRVLNGQPRSPHSGLDIAAPAGAPIRAPADGIVALAEKNLYYTGGTVMLDHGYGLTTIYAHMSAVAVRVGQRVRKGDVIGRVGATGRVTGPHLHWGVNLFKTRLDPALLIGLGDTASARH